MNMNKHKRLYAMLLAVMLILTIIPTGVFAQEGVDFNDVLTYNCGSKEVTIGKGETADSADQDSGDISSEELEATFDEDGSYTIQLEENAFFPYEIQFQYGGKTTVETFATPDSMVTVGGHQIRVASSYSEDAISQIGFYIDGKYVAATPDAKVFRTTSHAGRSLLPLQEVEVTLDLTRFTPAQLKAVEVSAIVDGINGVTDPDAIAGGKTVLWDHTFMPDGSMAPSETFRPIGTAPVNMASGSTEIEMLVGTENQLDGNNIRYIIYVNRLTRPQYYMALYPEGESNSIVRSSNGQTKNGVTLYKLDLEKKYPLDAEYRLGIYDNGGSQGKYTVGVFSGHFNTAEDAEAASGANITKKIYNQSMSQLDAGYKANYSTAQQFTIVTKMGNELIELKKISVQVYADDSHGVEILNLRSDLADQTYREYVGYNEETQYDESTQVTTEIMGIDPPHLLDQEYYLGFTYYSDGEEDVSKVTKAVVGHYNSLEDAAAQEDIKSALLPEDLDVRGSGYLANYKDGVKFTIFAEGEVYKYTVRGVKGPESSDTYLQVSGAEGIESVYRVAFKDDSGVGQFGYQILLVNDEEADLSQLKPLFTTVQNVKAFVAGTEQVSGQTVQDFSGAPVQYTARAANGSDIKNYWISFIKKVAGAKLFVVIDGEKPDEREVFFDAYTQNHHDIFLSNIGDATLTGLNVELKDAKNVKLDGYWKVGGSGNETLAPFGEKSQEMSNIAKIRLLPDGEGEVSGTLVISSGNGGSYTIALKGYAGNPTIITPALKDGVKYVPYSFLIQSNNKYDWNRVTFSLEEGTLPKGMVLRPSGELYGVPTEMGTFTFTVCAEYSDYRFKDTFKEFTLNVLQNTDQNVAEQVDEGYNILDFIPSNITTGQEYIFRSAGNFNEFIDFWIDGKKLVKGEHYTAEEGSTAITISAQTFQDFGKGTHTVAAEFREGGDTDKDMKRAAQNYSLGYGGGNNNSNTGGGSGGGTGGGTGGAFNKVSGNTADKRNTAAVDPVAAAKQAANAAAAAAVSRLVVELKNVDTVTLAEQKEIVAIAQKAGKSPWLNVDTLSSDRKSVDVRVGVNPALATTDLRLSGSSTSKQALNTKAFFEKFFSNPIAAVVSLSQKKDFGQPVTICVKIPPELNAADLVLYSYDAITNSYQVIQKPDSWVDINGYLHFNTSLADNIILSVGALKS